jgi:hypothetical protein
MSHPKLFICVITAAAPFAFSFQEAKTPADYVNPMIKVTASEKAGGSLHGLGNGQCSK